MARTRTISPNARLQRSYELRRHDRQANTPPSTSQRNRGTHHSNYPRQQTGNYPQSSRGDALFVHRQTVGEHITEIDLFLAVMRGLPRPNTAFNLQQRRRGDSLLVPMLDKHSLTTYRDALTGTMPRPINYLRQQLERKGNIPESFATALGNVPVKDVIEIGPRHARAVALELDSPEMQDEIARFAEITDGLHEYHVDRPHDLSSPHITIASFPGSRTVPSSVMSAIEETTPMAINVGAGRFA